MLRLLEWLRRGPPVPADAGARGEWLAEAYLRRECGWTTLARNWRNPADEREELDLVMGDGEIVVFIEVKARRAGALVPGYFAVDRRKKRVLRHCCAAYLRQLRPRPRTFRFDVVEVELEHGGGAEPVIRHFENVPLFTKGFRP